MPFKFHKGAMAFGAVITAISASSAMAQTHEVMILDQAFFPAVLYVQPGDQLNFINSASSARSVGSQAGEWNSGTIEVLGSSVYTITADSPLIFESSNPGDSVPVTYEGTLSFAVPPLSE